MADYADDLTKAETLEGDVSGQLVPNEDGYLRAVFTDTTREYLKRTFRQSMSQVVKDHTDINARREANLKAYEAGHVPGQAIDLPVVKRDVNQQYAWHLDAIFSKEPAFTARALDNDDVPLVVDEGDGEGAQLATKPADEYAKELEALINFYTLHKIGFKKSFRAWLLELLRDGNRPPIFKVIHEHRERMDGGLNIVLNGDKIASIEKEPAYRKVKDGESVRIEVIPGDKFYVPFPYDDIQKAPFVFQEFEESAVAIKDKIARRVYDFCRDGAPPADVLDLVLSGAKSQSEVEKWRADGRRPQDPSKDVDLYELWFDCPFSELVPGTPATPDSIDPETLAVIPGEPEIPEEIVTRMVPMCATVHKESGEWLNCYENYRWDKIRPFFAGRMQDRPFSFSAYSTGENVAPFQRLMSQLFNSRLKNIAVANVKTFGVREGSPSWRYFNKYGFKLVPGQMWPFGAPDDVKSEPLGTPIESNSGEIAFLNSEAQKMSVVMDHDRGEVQNRTPVGTVTFADSLAKVQPRAVLDQIRDTIGDVLKCLVRTLAQFNPGGMRVPFRDPITKDLVEVKVVGFPLEWRDGAFEFDIAATGSEETAQSLSATYVMLSGEVSTFNTELMQTVAASMTPNPENGMLPPPPLMMLAMTTIINRRNILARVFHQNKLNADEYLPTVAQLKQLPLELMDLQMFAQQQQGGANVSAPPPGGGVPGGEALGGGVSGMEGPPGDAGISPGGVPPNL